MHSENICKFNQARSSDLNCTRFVYETHNAQAEPKCAATCQVGLVTSGSGMLTAALDALPLTVGDLFCIAEGERFSISGGADFTYYYVCFHGRRAEELAGRFGFAHRVCVHAVDAEGRLAAFCADCLQQAGADNLDIWSEAVLLYLLGHLHAPQKPRNDLLRQMITLTNEQFASPGFSLATLSETLGYDAKYLSFLFKRRQGIRFTEYLRDLRIKHAVFLMEEGVVSVKNVALLSGFGDALYFSKIFKAAMGSSPKEYIETLHGAGDAKTGE